MVRAPDPSDTARRRLEALSPAAPVPHPGAVLRWTPQRHPGGEAGDRGAADRSSAVSGSFPGTAGAPHAAAVRADELRTPTSPVPRVVGATSDGTSAPPGPARPLWPELRVVDGLGTRAAHTTGGRRRAPGRPVPEGGPGTHSADPAVGHRVSHPDGGAVPDGDGPVLGAGGGAVPDGDGPVLGVGGGAALDGDRVDGGAPRDGAASGADDVVRRLASGRLARARDEYAARYGAPLEREHEGPAGPAARRWAVPTRVGLVAALAVALVAGVVVARAASAFVPQAGQAVELPEVTGAPGTVDRDDAGPEPGTGPAAPTAAASEPVGPAESSRRVVVHVVGHVAQPGIVELPEGSRVTDALTAAGGPSPSADLAVLNLARVLVDGEQVAVSAVGEVAPVAPPDAGAGAQAGGGPLDLNTADVTALDALPGIGPVLAGRIVAWREEHGRFRSLEELAEVEGIGPALLERLASTARV